MSDEQGNSGEQIEQAEQKLLAALNFDQEALTENLDELVIDALMQQASETNNAGTQEQIRFLMNRMSLEELTREVVAISL